MSNNLYRNAVQANRVTVVAQQALASPNRNVVTHKQRHLSVPRETLVGTVALWASHNTALRRRATALVEIPCREHGITIQTLGEYPLFAGIKLVHGTTSDVIIVPAEEDPLLVTGEFPLPKVVAARLRAIERAGVPFEQVRTYIAHEVPCYSVDPHGPIPIEVVRPPVPAQTRRTSERLGAVACGATISLLKGLRRTATVGILGAGAATVGGIAAAGVLLDPLIFGAVADERGMATWFVLAQWAW